MESSTVYEEFPPAKLQNTFDIYHFSVVFFQQHRKVPPSWEAVARPHTEPPEAATGTAACTQTRYKYGEFGPQIRRVWSANTASLVGKYGEFALPYAMKREAPGVNGQHKEHVSLCPSGQSLRHRLSHFAFCRPVPRLPALRSSWRSTLRLQKDNSQYAWATDYNQFGL